MSKTIVQGADAKIAVNLKLVKCDNTKVPFDLTGATEITFCYPLAAGGYDSVTLTATEITIVSNEGGQLLVLISDTKTALMKTGEQSVEVVVDKSGDIEIFQLEKAVTVKKRICA